MTDGPLADAFEEGEAMTPDLLAEARARHVRLPADGDAVPRDSCYCCGQPWPCDVAKLAALLTPERLAAALHDDV